MSCMRRNLIRQVSFPSPCMTTKRSEPDASGTKANDCTGVSQSSLESISQPSRRKVMKAAGVLSGLGALGAASGVAEAGGTDTDEFDLLEITVAEIHEAFYDGELTAVELVEAYIDRVEAFDDELNSVITRNPDVISRAEELDSVFEDSGLQGAFHGVPIIVKDNFDTADMPTTGGAVVFEDSVPTDDSVTIERFREAGAIIFAKVNLSEFALNGLSTGTLIGQTKNPYDLTRTPGGSSGGTGTALAANFGTVGLGTDTVNSIRSPASACSLVGIRPTLGLISRDGIIPLSGTQDTGGPMARRVEDAARALDIMVGYDPADPATARSAGHIPETYMDALDSDGLDGACIGALRGVFGDCQEVVDVAEQALSDMEALGATVVDISDEFDVDQLIEENDVQDYEIQHAFNDYLESLEDPPVDSFAEYVETGEYEPSTEDSLFSVLESPPDPDEEPEDVPEYLARLYRHGQAAEHLYTIMADNNVDALVFPHQRNLVVEIGEDVQRGRNGFLTSGTGLPGLVVPGGYSSEGVPIGMSLIGPEFSEETLIKFAYAYEQETQHRRPPEDFAEL
jgi:amidase